MYLLFLKDTMKKLTMVESALNALWKSVRQYKEITIYLLLPQTALIKQITYICPMRALSTILQSFITVWILQDLTDTMLS